MAKKGTFVSYFVEFVYFSCPGVVIDSKNCSSNSVNCTNGVTLRPCCLGLYCQCQVISQSKCSFQGGHWHKDKVKQNIALDMATVGFHQHFNSTNFCTLYV